MLFAMMDRFIREENYRKSIPYHRQDTPPKRVLAQQLREEFDEKTQRSYTDASNAQRYAHEELLKKF